MIRHLFLLSLLLFTSFTPLNTWAEERLLKTLSEEREEKWRTHILLIDKIVECESSGRHTNIWGDTHTRHPAYGIAQFQRRTFYWLADKSGLEGLKWKRESDQIQLLSWAVANGYGSLWTCYRKQMRGEWKR